MLLRDPGELVYRAWRNAIADAGAGGDDLPASGPPPRIVWRLVSVNRRGLAWSPRRFLTTVEAHEQARAAIERVVELDFEPLRRDTLHGWQLMLDGEPAVIGGRWYTTIRDRNRSAGLTLAAFRLGADRVLSPLPFDSDTGEFAPDVVARRWIDQAQFELGSRAVEPGTTLRSAFAPRPDPSDQLPAAEEEEGLPPSAVDDAPGPVGAPSELEGHAR